MLIFPWLLFKGGVHFFGKPTAINNGWIRYTQTIQQRLLDAFSSLHNLSVLLLAVEQSHTTQTALPLAWLHTCVCCVATIQGWRLFCSELPIVRLLFEGGNWHLFQEVRYSLGDKYSSTCRYIGHLLTLATLIFNYTYIDARFTPRNRA